MDNKYTKINLEIKNLNNKHKKDLLILKKKINSISIKIIKGIK